MVKRIVLGIGFMFCLLLSIALAQEGTEISGIINNWTAGEATILVLPEDVPFEAHPYAALGAPGTIDAAGQFTVVLPPSVAQHHMRAAQAVFINCDERSITPPGVRMMFADFHIVQDDESIGTLRQEFVPVWYQPGAIFVRSGFFTDDAEISANCEETNVSPPISSRYDLSVQQGWNQVVNQLIEPSYPERFTERVSAEPVQTEMIWVARLNGGIGILVEPLAGTGLLIDAIEPDFPAALAGIQLGDIIVELDGEDVRSISQSEAVARLRGLPGSSLTVGIQREGEDGVLHFELERTALD